MPADVSKAKNFLLTTDFPLDKVILLDAGMATVPFPVAGYLIPILYDLMFTPLVSGNWSLTSDFSVAYEFGSGTFPSSNAGASNFNISMDIYADGTGVFIDPTNVSGAPVDIYYHVFGLEPSDSETDVPFTSNQGDRFVLNTDYNYTKLYMDDTIISPPTPSTQTITHNLGYRPQVMPWITNSLGERRPVDVTLIAGGAPLDYGVVVTNSTVNFELDGLSTVDRIDNRLYLDENA